MTLRVCALYPDLMNIYADRGNLLMLERRCAWRGIEFRLHASGLGEPLRDEHDLYYIGGGQDSDQRRCAGDLAEHKAAALRDAAARGAIVLGVCGGYQLLGRSYELGEETIDGIGLLDVRTVRGSGPRLAGNIAGRTAMLPARRGGRAVRRGVARPRKRRREWHRGRTQRQRHRHLRARTAAAEELVAGGLADRAGDGRGDARAAR